MPGRSEPDGDEREEQEETIFLWCCPSTLPLDLHKDDIVDQERSSSVPTLRGLGELRGGFCCFISSLVLDFHLICELAP